MRSALRREANAPTYTHHPVSRPPNDRALETPSRLYVAAGRALPARCSSAWKPLRGEPGRDHTFGGDGVRGLPGRGHHRRDRLAVAHERQELPVRRVRQGTDLASGPLP